MSEEKSLSQIAMEVILETTYSSTQDTCDRVARAVEKEVLSRLKKSEAEPVAGQELTHHQVLDWIKKRGSTDGLQLRCPSLSDWENMSGIHIVHTYTSLEYRVAPKKANDPDDPTTWEKGVAIFRRDAEDAAWILDVFRSYSGELYKYCTEHSRYKHAKLATPEQIEAWKLINGEL